jgi:hypothetical protein
MSNEYVIEGLPPNGSLPFNVPTDRGCLVSHSDYTLYPDLNDEVKCNIKCARGSKPCWGIEWELIMPKHGNCKVFHQEIDGTTPKKSHTCFILGRGEDKLPLTLCPKTGGSKRAHHLKEKAKGRFSWLKSQVGLEDEFYPQKEICAKKPMCKGKCQKTQCMTKDTYDSIVSDVGVALESVKTNLEDCWAGNCPETDWAGCVLRMAGHDFMDYDAGKDTGGSDGCTDMNHEDNKGLKECLIDGEYDQNLVDIYEKYCVTVSLADFLVIAAEGVILHTRENVLMDDPMAPKIDLKNNGPFMFGRQTSHECPGSAECLPNPERGCMAVEDTFVSNMGLTWRQSAALMGVHSLGQARGHNSGYVGWWSDPENSRKFNNNYFVSLQRKGWRPQKAVCGNEEKNQWYASGPGRVKQGENLEFMLDTDMCLAFSETDPVGASTNGNGVGDPVLAKRSMCCGWMMEHPTTHEHIQSYNEACGLFDLNNCGSTTEALGAAGMDVTEFADDEAVWLKVFQEAWTKATTNGHKGLMPLRDSCP